MRPALLHHYYYSSSRGGYSVTPTPLAVWDFTGLAFEDNGTGVANDYGTTASSQISRVNSVINTDGPDLTSLASPHMAYSLKSPYHPFGVATPSNQYMELSEDLILSGDFTISFTIPDTHASAVHYLFSNTGGDTTTNVVWFQQNRIVVRFNTTTQYSVTFPELLDDVNRLYKVILQKEGTNLRASVDGGATWSSDVVVSSGLTLTVNRIFGNPTGGNVWDEFLERIWIDDSALTQDELDQRFNYLKSDDVVIDAHNTELVPSGITYADLVNGYVDDVVTASTIGSPQKATIVTNGGYSYILSNGPTADPHFSYQRLHVFDHALNKSGHYNIGVFNEDTDIHNFNSIGRIGNRIAHFGATWHYDAATYTTVRWRVFGDDFGFTSLTELAQHKGIPSRNWPKTQYHHLEWIGSTAYLYMQEYGFSSSSAHRTLLGKSTDGCKSWTKIPAVDLGSGTKFIYERAIHVGTGSEIYLLSVIADAAASGKKLTAHFRRTSDGITYTNLEGTYSKNVITGGPLTEAELNTNFQLKDGTAATQGTQVGQGFVTADGLIYFTIYDPTTDVWQIAYGEVGQADFTYVDIPWDSKTMVTAPFSGTAGEYVGLLNRAVPLALRTGANAFDYYGFEVNGGFWRLLKFSTADNFATGSFIENVTNDDTKQHNLVIASPEYEFSDSAIIKCTGATGADAGKMFLKVVK